VVTASLPTLALWIIGLFLLGFIGGWYVGTRRRELWLKLLRNRRERTDGRYQERIRRTEERIRRTKR
jgi:hypothetical protein